jgi:hypothetical protein
MKAPDMGEEEVLFLDDCFVMAGGNEDACFVTSVFDLNCYVILHCP